MKLIFVAIISLFFCLGCSSIPFQRTTYQLLGEIEPTSVRDNFSRLLPTDFQTVDSIVFRYNKRAISAIGYTAVDISNNTVKAACLNHLGVKLLEFQAKGERIEHRFVLEELNQQGDLIQAVAADIRRIYFDRIPISTAEVSRRKYEIVFRQPFKAGFMEYVFAGDGNLLVEKRYYEDKHIVWRVSYYEYKKKNGKIYPGGIMLKHYPHNYQLVIHLKEIHS